MAYSNQIEISKGRWNRMKFRKCAAGVLGTVPGGGRSPEAPWRAKCRTGAAYQPSVNGVEHLCQQDGKYADAGNSMPPQTMENLARKAGTEAVRDRRTRCRRETEITPLRIILNGTRRNDQSICYLALGLSYPNAEGCRAGA